jgi:hypothetical protein
MKLRITRGKDVVEISHVDQVERQDRHGCWDPLMDPDDWMDKSYDFQTEINNLWKLLSKK